MHSMDSHEYEEYLKGQSQINQNQSKMENKTKQSVNNVSIGGKNNAVTINNNNRDEAALEALKETLESIKEMQDTIISNLQEINKKPKIGRPRK